MKLSSALVTGAGGFIGSHLVERLAGEGVRVRALVHYNSQGSEGNLRYLPSPLRPMVEVVAGDIQDPFFVRSAVRGMDAVFHLAALIAIPYSYIAPWQYASVNVLGTINVMQACRDEGTPRVVHTSTSETYGTALYTPIDEAHALQGQSPYSASKIGADKIAESFHLSFDLPVVTVRPFNTFGPRQSARAVIPTIVSQALAGQQRIRLGSLTPVRDLTFVKDTVEGFLAASRHAAAIGQTINLGNGKGITIGELAARILNLCGSNSEIISDEQRVRPDKSEVLRLVCDNSRALSVLDWKPTVALDDGLSAVIEFVRKHPELYRPDIYAV